MGKDKSFWGRNILIVEYNCQNKFSDKSIERGSFMRSQIVGIFYLLLILLPIHVFAEAHNLRPREAFALVGERSDLYLLDVRTPGEYQQVRLTGARLIPIDQMVSRLSEVPKDRPILVYCAVGSRSSQVVNYLARQGYPEIYNLDGGIYSWAQQGYPIVQGGP
jgi:rhodanese-related sulfurtransferase